MVNFSLQRGTVLTAVALCVALLAGCSAVPVVQNKSLPEESAPAQEASTKPTELKNRYSLMESAQRSKPSPVRILLAFSGGGTRASAMSYGVLRGLQQQEIPASVGGGSLLKRVEVISSVSGGSFTAAYYGLYGEKGFDDFEKKFLRRNVRSELVSAVFSPLQLFSSTGRTDVAERIYADTIFQNATYADMLRAGGPLVVINATDLSQGSNFAFLQEYFDLLCSDLSSFPVARAVTASSAVPVMFSPVVLRNYSGCSREDVDSYLQTVMHLTPKQSLRFKAESLRSYADKTERPYIHLVDGGLTDNLGVRAINDFVDVAGGMKAFANIVGIQQVPPPKHLLVIVVDASTENNQGLDKTAKAPTIEQTLDAVTDVQLHRYNEETLDKARVTLEQWKTDLATPEHPVNTYFIHLKFKDLDDKRRQYINQIPTTLALDKEQVDTLIGAAKDLLQSNPQYRQFLQDVGE
ncbi:patatin-like phospholipase family protein [Curvibacter sp. CHRR-16]|uniref:patatin-like phospholipase family protein n=1 Tax=Curvibacter sp. CHRR-16 TaxID=2835872 RepID=UPI001BDB327B|nr:patatin-like phospholipase family protein [Curvibacter sp. CHRR-16]MBT0570750.1 patatin-like phospholipase family protein [Curvibacter sp. CHRR-16]